MRLKVAYDDQGREWVTWETASKAFGYETLKAMVNAKTIPSRRHADIPASLGIEWPLYLEIGMSLDKRGKVKRQTIIYTYI